jgi:hypothetical protein
MKYFTQEETQAFIEQNAPKYPSIKFLGSKQPLNFGGEEHHYAGIWSDGVCVAAVNNEAEWNALVKFCFGIVGDVNAWPVQPAENVTQTYVIRYIGTDGDTRIVRYDGASSDAAKDAWRSEHPSGELVSCDALDPDEEERIEASARQYETDAEMDEEERIEAKHAAYTENMAISQIPPDDREYLEERMSEKFVGYPEF